MPALKDPGDLLHPGVERGLDLPCLRRTVAINHGQDHEAARHRTAHLPEPAHAAPKGGRHAKDGLSVKPGHIIKSTGQGLCAVIPG